MLEVVEVPTPDTGHGRVNNAEPFLPLHAAMLEMIRHLEAKAAA